jgi:glycosyltransferase involved in cell wall biosynthesis
LWWGSLLPTLKELVQQDGLTSKVTIAGTVQKDKLIEYYRQANYLLFFTQTSEGWPKAVAESMFWGVVPVTKPISVVAQMLDYGKRGILLTSVDPVAIAAAVHAHWQQPLQAAHMSNLAMEWSRTYTLDKLAADIRSMI